MLVNAYFNFTLDCMAVDLNTMNGRKVLGVIRPGKNYVTFLKSDCKISDYYNAVTNMCKSESHEL